MTEEEIKAIAEKNKHIPTSEIEQDIADTQAEIVQLEAEHHHLDMTPAGSSDYKMNMYRASSKKRGIEERKKFVEKLKAIIEYRKNHG